ncbi:MULTISPECIES: hypothetical protein [unclassified Streptomyces]|nr:MULTISPECIES: hypothetical protein [unclassified Streptomyces]MCX4529793.1 hypothetical protein [Streptomyces sp. NBC_01551]MCX4539635.1 hypothetical protein [Streptomyces sp. NBC_01565]
MDRQRVAAAAIATVALAAVVGLGSASGPRAAAGGDKKVEVIKVVTPAGD